MRSPAITLRLLLMSVALPIDFGALDGQPVDVLFSLISPTARQHLQLISQLSYALHDAGFRQALARHAASDEILDELRRGEAGLAAVGARKAAT